YERVVNDAQLDARKPDLTCAGRHASAEPEPVRLRLIKQYEVLEMVPELDPESHHPPRVRSAGESLSEHPQADQHHESEAVMKDFGLHEPRIIHPNKTHRHRAWPMQHEELVG